MKHGTHNIVDRYNPLDSGKGEERYRVLFNSIDSGFCVIEVIFDERGKGVDYVFLETNAAFERQTGLENIVGKRMHQLVPDHEEYWYEIYGRIARDGKSERFERPAAALGHHYEVYAFPFGDPGSHAVGVLFNDISERKRIEAANELLKQELSHRIKNIFAVVQALAAQTARGAASTTAFVESFSARLQSMARAHDLVLKSPITDLQAIVLRSVEGHRTMLSRISVEGPPVRLTSRQAVGLSLALHELCTNAAKYGALASPAGVVRIFWTVDSTDHVHFHWEERQGPPVSPPKHKGFGTLLIERVCANELDGTRKMEYAPEGLSAAICFPLTQ